MTPAELLRCVIAARTIETEIDQVHTSLLLANLSPTTAYDINLSLEIIDNAMATLTDLMATETAAPAPTIPSKEA